MAAVEVAGLPLAVGQHRDAGVRDRFAFAGRGRGRSTVIRAGLAIDRRRRGRRRGRAGGDPSSPLGLIPHHERTGEPAGAGGDDGQEQQGQRGGLELVEQHGTEDLLGQGRGGGGERPAGGVTGREGDRGPGGGIAQEG